MADETVLSERRLRSFGAAVGRAARAVPASGTPQRGRSASGRWRAARATLALAVMGAGFVHAPLVADQASAATLPGAPTATQINGVVWRDTDSDGVNDASEVGFTGAVVTLFDNAGVQVGRVTTTATGIYTFNGLSAASGPYRVDVWTSTVTYPAPSNWRISGPPGADQSPYVGTDNDVTALPDARFGQAAGVLPGTSIDIAIRPRPEATIGFLGVGSIDGTAPFTSCASPTDTAAPGGDCGPSNRQLRTDDILTQLFSVTLDNFEPGTTDWGDVIVDHVITPTGGAQVVHQAIPVSCSPPPTGTGGTGAPVSAILANTPTAGQTTLRCNLGRFTEGQAETLTINLRPTRNSPSGSTFTTSQRVYIAGDRAVPQQLSPSLPPFTISATPSWDLRKFQLADSWTTRCIDTDFNPATPCENLFGMRQLAAARIQTAQPEGNAPVSPITFTELLQMRTTGGAPYNGEWYITSCIPAVSTFETVQLTAGTGTCRFTRNIANQTAPYTMTVSTDWSRPFPTNTFGGTSLAGGPYIANDMSVEVFVPLRSIDMVDGVINNVGTVNVTNRYSNFDPVDPTGISNFGDGFEPGYCVQASTVCSPMPNGSASNNVAALGDGNASGNIAITSSTWGGKTLYAKMNAVGGNLSDPPGVVSTGDGKGLTTAGMTAVSNASILNTGATPLRNAGICDVFDNSVWRITTADKVLSSTGLTQMPNASNVYAWGSNETSYVVEYAHLNFITNPLYNSSRVGAINVIDSPDWPGVDTFNTSTGRFEGGWATQMSATCEHARPPAGWFTNPTAVPGGLDAINAVRLRAINPTADLPGASLRVPLETRATFFGGPHAGQLIPNGTVLANSANRSGGGGVWVASGYSPSPDNGSAFGDRLTMAGFGTSLAKRTITPATAIDATTTMVAGAPIVWELRPATTVAAPGVTATVRNVIVRDELPPHTTYNSYCTVALNNVAATATLLPTSVQSNTRLSGPAAGWTLLTYNLGDVAAGAAIQPIRICTDTNPLAPTNTTVTNTARLTADGDVTAESERDDAHAITLQQVGSIQISKTVDRRLDPRNDGQSYTVEFANFSSAITVATPTVIDVLPWIGDGVGSLSERTPASNFQGQLTLDGAPTVTWRNGSVPGAGDPNPVIGDFFYTADAPATINNNPDANTSTWCTIAQFATAGCPASFAEATAWKYVSRYDLDLDGQPRQGQRITFRLNAANNRAGDIYTNRAAVDSPTLPAAQFLRSQNATVEVISFVLGDLLFFDVDNDGIYAASTDRAMPAGVTVELYRVGDPTLVATTTTNANGRYRFLVLDEGDYYVRVPAGQFAGSQRMVGFIPQSAPSTTPNSDTNEAVDHNARQIAAGDPLSGVESPAITLRANVPVSALDEPTGQEPLGDNTGRVQTPIRDDFTNWTLDLGFTATGSLGDRVWYDINADGVQNSGEAGINGVDVTVRWYGFDGIANNADDVVYNTTTGGDGDWTVTGLPAGTYAVTTSGFDTDFAPSYDLNGIATANTATVTLTGAQARTDVDFGYTTRFSLGNFVFNDINRDGNFDPGTDAGIAGVTVELYREGDTTPIATTTSDEFGVYSFTNLTSGRYFTKIPSAEFTAGDLLDAVIAPNAVADPNGNADEVADHNALADGAGAMTGVIELSATLAADGTVRSDEPGGSRSNITLDYGVVLPIYPQIAIEKLVNGDEADVAPGADIVVGEAVTWTFRVTNPGDVGLVDVTVADDNGTPADAADDFTMNRTDGYVSGDADADDILDTGEVWMFQSPAGVAVEGQYTNNATATGDPADATGTQIPDVDDVTASDAANYLGGDGSVITVDKSIDTGPTVAADGTWTIVYDITVNNSGVGVGQYDLSDTLRFGDGVNIVSQSATSSTAGVTADAAWNGTTSTTLVTDQSILAGRTHIFTVTATVALPDGVAASAADCTLLGGESGTGLRNDATLTTRGVASTDSVCRPVNNTIDAVDNDYGTVAGGTSTTTATVLDGDTLNGNPATTTNVVLTPGTSPAAGLLMSTDGTVAIAPTTPPGTYEYPYTICATVDRGTCDTAIATIRVSSVISAIDDAYAVPNGGGTTGTVIGNDTLNGNPATTSSVTLTPGLRPHSGVSMNSDGTIDVNASVPPGVYEYPYQICSAVDPDVCDTAIATITMPSTINAENNDFGTVPGGISTTTASVLGNDTLNDNPATVTNVELTPGTPWHPGLSMNADGTIDVASNTPPGTYRYPYTICSIVDPDVCDTADAIVTVSSVIDAVDDDFGTIIGGTTTTTASVLDSDALNGNPATTTNVMLTPGASPDPGLEMNPDGTITIDVTTPPGTYEYPYEMCSIVDPDVCDTAVATVTVGSIGVTKTGVVVSGPDAGSTTTARAGDVIEWKMAIANPAEIDGRTVLTDSIPAGTEYVAGSLETPPNWLSGYSTDNFATFPPSATEPATASDVDGVFGNSGVGTRAGHRVGQPEFPTPIAGATDALFTVEPRAFYCASSIPTIGDWTLLKTAGMPAGSFTTAVLTILDRDGNPVAGFDGLDITADLADGSIDLSSITGAAPNDRLDFAIEFTGANPFVFGGPIPPYVGVSWAGPPIESCFRTLVVDDCTIPTVSNTADLWFASDAGAQTFESSDHTFDYVAPGGCVEIAKTVSSGPTANGDGTWTIAYDLAVTNTSAADGTYTLTDALAFGEAITITSGAVTSSPAGATLDTPAWDGASNAGIVTNRPITALTNESFTVTVIVAAADGVAPTAGDCTLDPGETGTGLTNATTLRSDGITTTDSACAPITNIIDAVDNPFGVVSPGATTPSVLAGDTLNGNPATLTNVELAPGTASNPGLTMNPDGTISVGANVPPGDYEYPYTICSIADPDVCDVATATLTVESVIDAIDDPFGTLNSGATTASVLDGDTLNGNPAATTNVELTPGAPSNPGLSMGADGTISVGANVPPGDHEYPYEICSIVDPDVCDTAVATLTVGSVVDAVDDPFGSQAPGATTGSVLDNDTLNGNPATLTNVNLALGTPSHAGLSMNPDGTITVAANVPPGDYEYPYEICSIVDPDVCDTATATLAVEPVIDAIDDSYPSHVAGSPTASVLDNDTINSNPVTATDVTLIPGAPSDPGLSMNPDGTISVASTVAPGTYTYPYEICSTVDPDVCDPAVATLTVGSAVDAVDNDFGLQTPGTSTTSVLAGDTLNSNPATLTNVTLMPGTSPDAGLVMNADGTITISPTAPPETYEYPYEICSIADPTVCDTAVATVEVASVIDAVDDAFGSRLPGTDTPSVLDSDTLNGNPATTSNVTLTPGTSPNPGLTMNPDGTVSIASNVMPGVYEYPYTICSIVHPDVCDEAIVTITVGSIIDAVLDPFGNQIPGATTASVLDNDLLNNNTADLSNVTLTGGTPTGPGGDPAPGLTMKPDGTIAVATNTPPGDYEYPYTICSIADPTVCDTAMATLSVDPVVDAVDDPFGNQTLGATTASVFDNDTLNSNPVDATTVTLTPGAPSDPGLTMNANGAIDISATTPPGDHTYPYTICSVIDPDVCDTATATITIGSSIDAVDDPYGVQSPGTTTPDSVLTGDTLNGNPATLTNVTHAAGASPNPGLTMNPDATITIAANTPPGDYSYPYEICSIVNPGTCDIATATLTVESVIDAVDNDFGVVNPGTVTTSVLAGDTLNDNPATTTNVTLMPGTSPHAGLTMNAAGTIAIAANTPPGGYEYPYTICSTVHSTVCDTAVATLTVDSVVDAVDNPFGVVSPGATTPSVLVGDTLNANPATLTNVTLTPGVASHTGLTMSPDGTITIAANTPPGGYTYTYTICSTVVPDVCDTATATITVESVIAAVDNPFGTQALSTATTTVLAGDTLNGNPATTSNVALTPGVSPAAGLVMNADGTIIVGATVHPGDYTYPYTICSIVDSDICDTAEATLTIGSVIDAIVDSFGALNPGATTASVLRGDTLNGNPATTTDVVIAPGVSPEPGLTMNTDGTIAIATDTPPGTYSYPYTICSVVDLDICDTAIATLTVDSIIDALDNDFGVQSPGAVTGSAFAGDTLNGNPVDATTVVLTPGASPLAGIVMNADGTITVGASVPPGVYSYPYTICSIVDPDVCDTATVRFSVEAVIDAVDNPFGVVERGGVTLSVLGNDTINGNPPASGAVTLTPGTAPHDGIVMNADGTISIGADVPGGTYTYTYTICAVDQPTALLRVVAAVDTAAEPRCDTATATLTVLAQIIANPDEFGAISDNETPSVFGRDLVDGVPATPETANLVPGTSPHPGLTMNPDGTISISAGVPAGTYTFPYTICLKSDPTVCSTSYASLSIAATQLPETGTETIRTAKRAFILATSGLVLTTITRRRRLRRRPT